MPPPDSQLAPYLTYLHDPPFVEEIDVEEAHPTFTSAGALYKAVARIAIRTPAGRHRFYVDSQKALPDALKAANLARTLKASGAEWIVTAPMIDGDAAQQLAAHDVNYVDGRGLCRLRVGRRYLAQLEARHPASSRADKGLRVPGYRVLCALLVNPLLLASPLRRIAEAANVSRQAVINVLDLLEEEGILVRSVFGLIVVPSRWSAAMDLWLAGYRELVRPKLLVGTYHTHMGGPAETEEHVRALLGRTGPWRWGGSAAAFRLTRQYRGTHTVVHLQDGAESLVQRLGVRPDPGGHLILLRAPGQLTMEGMTPDTVHPVLVYSEMLQQRDERCLQAAQDLRRRFLDEEVKAP